MKRRFLVLTAVFISTQLRSQDTATGKHLDEVFVTATKFPQKQGSTGKIVTVIDQTVLQRNAGKTIAEILNYQAGIFINGASNNLGTNQDVYFRGASSGNVLILIDGVPAGDPSQINNSFDINNIAIGQVERIEILKGAQSTIWGSDAVAGVINIITKKAGLHSITPTAMLAYGSYGTFRGNAGLNGTIKKFSYVLGYQFTSSRGFSAAYDSTGTKGFDKDKYIQHTIQASMAYAISDRLSLKGSYHFSKYNAAIDAGAFQDDKDNFFDNKNTIGNMALTYTAAKLQLHLTQSFVKSVRVFTDDSASVGGFSKYARGHYTGNAAITDLFGNIPLTATLSLVSGLQFIGQQTNQDYLSISSFGPYVTALGDSAKATNLAVYSSLLWKAPGGFNMEAGLRFNKHSIYGSNATYTFNPSFTIDDNTRVFINISSAFKIPSLYQLYSEYGNKALKPETSNNYEIGLQSTADNKRSSFRITGFKRAAKNLIVFYTDPSTYSSRYINRDTQRDYGFELEGSITVGKSGSWTNNFTYVDGEGEENQLKVKNLYRRPNFTMNSVLKLVPVKNLTLVPSFRFVGTRVKGQYDAGPAQMPEYYTIDLYAEYAFAKQCRFFIDLRNITNQTYFDIVGYNSRKFNFMTGISFSL